MQSFICLFVPSARTCKQCEALAEDVGGQAAHAQRVCPQVELAATDQQRPLNVALQHPLTQVLVRIHALQSREEQAGVRLQGPYNVNVSYEVVRVLRPSMCHNNTVLIY